MRHSIRTLLIISLAMLVTICAACNNLQRAMSKIDAGMLRAKAIEALSEDAWYYQPCPDSATPDGRLFAEDLFFLGSHDYDRAQIIIVESMKQKDSEWTVQSVGTFEPYAWHTAYKDCIDRSRFEN